MTEFQGRLWVWSQLPAAQNQRNDRNLQGSLCKAQELQCSCPIGLSLLQLWVRGFTRAHLRIPPSLTSSLNCTQRIMTSLLFYFSWTVVQVPLISIFTVIYWKGVLENKLLASPLAWKDKCKGRHMIWSW